MQLHLILPLLVAAGAQQPAQPVTEIKVTADKIVVTPGPVLRHQSLDGLPAVPRGGVTITFRCFVDPFKSELGECSVVSGPPKWVQAARARLPGYRIDVDELDLPDSPRATIDIPVHLKREDRVTLSPPKPPHPDAGRVSVVSRASGPQAGHLIPNRAYRAELEPTITLSCQVRPDHSLFCPTAVGPKGPIDIDPALESETRAAFIFAAQQISGLMRVAPMLRDGTPSAGHQFLLPLKFVLPEE